MRNYLINFFSLGYNQFSILRNLLLILLMCKQIFFGFSSKVVPSVYAKIFNVTIFSNNIVILILNIIFDNYNGRLVIILSLLLMYLVISCSPCNTCSSRPPQVCDPARAARWRVAISTVIAAYCLWSSYACYCRFHLLEINTRIHF